VDAPGDRARHQGTAPVGLRVETAWPPPDDDACVAGAAPARAAARTAGCPFPEVQLSLTCGAGFYVRALARDLGAALRVPATLAALERTASSGLATRDATPFYALDSVHAVASAPTLRPSDAPWAASLPGALLLPVNTASATRLPPAMLPALAADVEAARLRLSDDSCGPWGGDALQPPRSGGVSPQLAAAHAPMCARELAATLALWSCDSRVVYEGVVLPAGVGSLEPAPQLPRVAVVCGGDSAPRQQQQPPRQQLVRVYALAMRGDAEALLGGAVMDVACAAARLAGVAASRGADASAHAVPVFVGLAWTLSPAQVLYARPSQAAQAAQGCATGPAPLQSQTGHASSSVGGAAAAQQQPAARVSMARVMTMLA